MLNSLLEKLVFVGKEEGTNLLINKWMHKYEDYKYSFRTFILELSSMSEIDVNISFVLEK